MSDRADVQKTLVDASELDKDTVVVTIFNVLASKAAWNWGQRQAFTDEQNEERKMLNKDQIRARIDQNTFPRNVERYDAIINFMLDTGGIFLLQEFDPFLYAAILRRTGDAMFAVVNHTPDTLTHKSYLSMSNMRVLAHAYIDDKKPLAQQFGVAVVYVSGPPPSKCGVIRVSNDRCNAYANVGGIDFYSHHDSGYNNNVGPAEAEPTRVDAAKAGHQEVMERFRAILRRNGFTAFQVEGYLNGNASFLRENNLRIRPTFSGGDWNQDPLRYGAIGAFSADGAKSRVWPFAKRGWSVEHSGAPTEIEKPNMIDYAVSYGCNVYLQPQQHPTWANGIPLSDHVPITFHVRAAV